MKWYNVKIDGVTYLTCYLPHYNKAYVYHSASNSEHEETDLLGIFKVNNNMELIRNNVVIAKLIDKENTHA